jgi:hypothetical protein
MLGGLGEERERNREREREREGMNVLGSYIWGVFFIFKCYVFLLI